MACAPECGSRRRGILVSRSYNENWGTERGGGRPWEKRAGEEEKIKKEIRGVTECMVELTCTRRRREEHGAQLHIRSSFNVGGKLSMWGEVARGPPAVEPARPALTPSIHPSIQPASQLASRIQLRPASPSAPTHPPSRPPSPPPSIQPPSLAPPPPAPSSSTSPPRPPPPGE